MKFENILDVAYTFILSLLLQFKQHPMYGQVISKFLDYHVKFCIFITSQSYHPHLISYFVKLIISFFSVHRQSSTSPTNVHVMLIMVESKLTLLNKKIDIYYSYILHISDLNCSSSTVVSYLFEFLTLVALID